MKFIENFWVVMIIISMDNRFFDVFIIGIFSVSRVSYERYFGRVSVHLKSQISVCQYKNNCLHINHMSYIINRPGVAGAVL